MSAPTHGCLTLCHLTHLLTVYFYECLQYLMEAKKAQQCLESTYKQLDSVSLVLDKKLIRCFKIQASSMFDVPNVF